MYRVEVDWAPAYELVVSLEAYASRQHHKTLDLGMDWVRGVRHALRPEIGPELSSAAVLDHTDILSLLVRLCPGERDACSFVRWLGGRSSGELYQLLEPYATRGAMLQDLTKVRDRSVRLLEAWVEQYFRGVDPAVLDALQADTITKRRLAEMLPAQDLIETATAGVDLTPALDEEEVVLLVPQYHYRPWNLFEKYRGMRLVKYPLEVPPASPDEPPIRLTRLFRALSDDSRLRILRLLTAGPHSFTDITRATELSKSTVHHHLVALRAAGLVRVRTTPKGETYTLREDVLDTLGPTLRAYLFSE
jgi:DNA-binding transcriptional ArsR family regulator